MSRPRIYKIDLSGMSVNEVSRAIQAALAANQENSKGLAYDGVEILC